MRAPSFSSFPSFPSALLALPLCAVALFGAVTPSPARADATATQYLKSKHDQVTRVLKAPSKDAAAKQAREEKVTALIAGLLDYATLSANALPDHWNARSQKERDEFVSLLRELVERNYRQNLENTLGYSIKYVAEQPAGKGVIVSSTARDAKNKRSPEVTIDDQMEARGAEWVVIDVTTDGVSMVQNYRSQFRRIIEKDGWAGLVGRMKKRLADGGTAI